MADIDLRVPVFDFDTGEFVIGLDGTVKTVTGSEAVGMIAVKAEETERGVFPVYGDFENEEENHVYGSDVKAYRNKHEAVRQRRKLTYPAPGRRTKTRRKKSSGSIPT